MSKTVTLRPDQTRPEFCNLSSVKALLKKLDYFHILQRLVRRYRTYKGIKDAWPKDITRFNFFSKNKFDKIPYIVRRRSEIVGLFSYFITMLGGIAYADKNNFIPVIDMKNFMNLYLYPDELGRVNSWEYYFDQPGNISLDESLSSRKYILGRDCALFERPSQTAEFFYNHDGQLDYWRNICRKYIRFTPAVLERLENMKQKYQGTRILGVLVRGTDYAALKPHGHPIPPTAEQAIAKVQGAMKSESFDSVYLATEDKNILAKFQAAFGDKLITPEADYINYDYKHAKFLAYYEPDRQNDKYLRGLDYLVSILFIAKFCKGFITCITSGSTGLMCLSSGFEYLYVFDLGCYE